ncbi:hypothetical protein QBC38DRAFT_189453 [Podospora fimiseda]|uniref:RBR-type E3 ubiquitin transferase n=1 Tax=Podospora fimiseda TaxID=252190 RepID=A0AAN7BQ63_9PEZI|nr:hypothetical protein QBC38DRAFT_189453 [Podospora fimiseda]
MAPKPPSPAVHGHVDTISQSNTTPSTPENTKHSENGFSSSLSSSPSYSSLDQPLTAPKLPTRPSDDNQGDGILFQDIDISLYSPPEILSEIPDDLPTEIRTLLPKALEKIIRHVEKEKEAKQQAKLKAIADAEAAAELEEARRSKAKEVLPESAPPPIPSRLFLRSRVSGGSSQAGPSNSSKQRRFNFRKVFHRNPSSTSSLLTITTTHSSLPLVTKPSDSQDTSSFTRFIYNHLVPKPAPRPSSSVLPAASTTSAPITTTTATTLVPAETIECTSCFDDILPSDGIQTICHAFCIDCFERLVQTAMNSEAQWPPKCCLNPFPWRTISKYVSKPLYQQYLQKEKEYKIPAAERIYCSTPDCGEWIPPTSPPKDMPNRSIQCPKGHSMCLLCRDMPHQSPETECPKVIADREMLNKLAEEQGWRPCIRCNICVEHIDGCAHVKCRCGAEFCYVCGEEYGTCDHDVEDVLEYKEATESRRIERQARELQAAQEADEEDQWLQEVLQQIADLARREREVEAQQQQKLRRLREKRRKMAEAEQKRREEARIANIIVKYAKLAEILQAFTTLQYQSLREGHHNQKDGERTAYTALYAHEKNVREEIQRKLEESIQKKEKYFEHEYRNRVAKEKIEEDKYKRELDMFSSSNKGKECAQNKKALIEFQKKNDKREKEWCKWRDEELAKMRCKAEDERAQGVRKLDALAQEHAESLKEMSKTAFAEGRWFAMVAHETEKLLEEMEAQEKEKGNGDGAVEFDLDEVNDDELLALMTDSDGWSHWSDDDED